MWGGGIWVVVMCVRVYSHFWKCIIFNSKLMVWDLRIILCIGKSEERGGSKVCSDLDIVCHKLNV